MHLRHSRLKNSISARGDTIVEVLIAIAIVSSVLAGAFSVTQKSSQAVRNSQEHAEMLQILQGQVELVRAVALGVTGSSDQLFGTTANFCLDPNTKEVKPYSGGVTIPTSNLSGVPAACKSLGISGFYNVGIHYTPATNVFDFTGWWDKLGGGNGINKINLSYKITPSN